MILPRGGDGIFHQGLEITRDRIEPVGVFLKSFGKCGFLDFWSDSSLLVHGLLNGLTMTVQPCAPVDKILGRIGELTRQLVRTVAGVDPETLDTMLTDELQRIAEALEADQATFETVAQGLAGRSLKRTWRRIGASMTPEPGLTIRVSERRGSSQTFSIAGGAQPWPAPVTEQLRAIGDLLGLAVHRCQQTRELDLLRSELADAVASSQGPLLDSRGDDDFDEIIGESQALRDALARVQEVAPTNASVVLVGETGTGKELFARAVHSRSTRRDRPFVPVNCAALPSTLIESELFGHERGAFTGAVSLRQGRFEVAHRGTLFLDEIGDLPAEVQAKLLRVLQEGEFERVGSSHVRRVDVRVIAATNRNLELAVSEGRFRADLYYRLYVYPIMLPPLRERLDDLPRLVWYFVNHRQRALNRKFTCVPGAVFATLGQHRWPGNVRELANVVERAMIHSTGSTLVLDETQRFPNAVSLHDASNKTLESVERCHIEEALRRARWRINGPGNAAEALGVHPNTLRFRMKKLGIQRPVQSPFARSLGRRSA